VPEAKRTDSYKFIEKKVKEGDQAYVITPLIEPSETLATVKAAKVEYERLKKIFPDLKLGLLHGRMKAKEKETVIKQSYCLLYTSNVSSEEGRRLKYLETTFNGLKLAELDLKIRGSGTIFSTAQHGRFDFKIASLSDLKLVEKTRLAAQNLLQTDATLDKHPGIRAKLGELTKAVMPD